MKKIFSQYYITARLFPTIIGLVPVFIFQYVFLDNILDIKSFISPVLIDISLSSVILYTFNQYFVRIPSKIFENLIFKNQLYFPATNFLMYSNREYSSNFKDEIRKSVKKDFSIELPNKYFENKHEIDARKRIKEIVNLIINKVRDGHLVLQHCAEYGFVRNLWGSSITGIIGSILIICYSNNGNLINHIGVALLILYSLYFLIGFFIIRYFSYLYAKRLIGEYYKISHE